MTDRETVRSGYEEHAHAYADRRSPGDRELAVLEAFLESVSRTGRILDAGCGSGEPVLRRLRADTERRVVGLDFARAQLALAADAAPHAELVVGDMTALPFREGVFDAVTASNAVVHVPLSDHQRVVDEFARVLRPGGRLLLSEAPAEFDRETDDWLGAGVEMTWHMAGADATRDQLRDAGFRLTNEWVAPDTGPDEPPKPPFFEAVLEA